MIWFRSSHQSRSIKKGALKNFSKFTRNYQHQSLFFNKNTLAQVFFCEFCEFFKKTFLTEHLMKTASVGSVVYCSFGVFRLKVVHYFPKKALPA